MNVAQAMTPSPLAPTAVRYLEGAAGGAVGAVVDSVGLGAVTLVHTPRAVGKAYHDLWTSERSLAYKGSASLIIPAVAVLATPVAAAIGLAVGAYQGAQDGYANGVPFAAKRSWEVVEFYDQFLTDTLKG